MRVFARIRGVLLALIATAALAACDRMITEPRTPARSLKVTPAQHDLSDTLACISGYVIIDGRVVCN